ncbi:hypothetical protein BDV96DRAFT_582341 [Lophiotrema nucula]|uniref:Uncharacterized protein n=1 Tax=Lophiotrema nucula TaxID=690887 RepID=A0A6A5YY81_9PLEO|nr:hypothetical protein BDV96DRAFT_582341 [Lophiotrema nucula]
MVPPHNAAPKNGEKFENIPKSAKSITYKAPGPFHARISFSVDSNDGADADEPYADMPTLEDPAATKASSTGADNLPLEVTDAEIEEFMTYFKVLARHGSATKVEAVVSAKIGLDEEIVKFRKSSEKQHSLPSTSRLAVQEKVREDIETLIALAEPIPKLRRICERGPAILKKHASVFTQGKSLGRKELVAEGMEVGKLFASYQEELDSLERALKGWENRYSELVITITTGGVTAEKIAKGAKRKLMQAEQDNKLQAKMVEELEDQRSLFENKLREAEEKSAQDEIDRKNLEKKHQNQIKKFENDLREARQDLADDAAKKELRETKAELNKTQNDRKQDTIRFESTIAGLKKEVTDKDIRIQNQQATMESLKTEKHGLRTTHDVDAAKAAGYDDLLYERDSLQERLSNEVSARETQAEKIRKLEATLNSKQATASQPSGLSNQVEHTEGLVNNRRKELDATTVQVDAIASDLDDVDAEIALLIQQMAEEEAREAEIEEAKQRRQPPTTTVPIEPDEEREQGHEFPFHAPSSNGASSPTLTISSGLSALSQTHPEVPVRKEPQLSDQFPKLPPATKPTFGKAQKPAITNQQAPESSGDYAGVAKKVADQKLKIIPNQDRSDQIAVKKSNKQKPVVEGIGTEHTQHGRPAMSFKDLCRDAMKRHNAGAG